MHLLIANGLSQDCVVDSVISDLPFSDAQSNVGLEDNWTFYSQGTDPWDIGIAIGGGADFAYELTLTETRTIFIDTCDPDSDFDTIVAVKNTDQCGADTSLWESDDSDQIFCPEGASSIPTESWYASSIDSLRLDPGTY